MYVYLMENQRPLDQAVVALHVEHLKALKRRDKLVLCGPFTDDPGGMVVFLADSRDEAIDIAKADPFIALGYKTFTLKTLEQATEENHYLLAP